MARAALLCASSLLAAAAENPDLRQHFRGFVAAHGRDYVGDAEEYERRFELFQEHVAAVEAQNAQADRRWTAGVNGLADRTPQELLALRGYRHVAKTSAAAVDGLGLAAVSAREVDIAKVPADFSWQPRLQAMHDVVDQGRCGSCWAVSSATVLRAHSELYQADRKFSAQQIVDCTPNPKSCGGKGGCKGATAELAMEYAAKRGLVLAEEREYTATDNVCPSNMQVEAGDTGFAASFLALRGKGGATVHSGADGSFTVEGGDGAKIGLIGWRKLPENKAEPLMEALYTSGPVTVSVAANSAWSMYSSGVMDACERDAVINHAVVLTGYGKEGKDGYWQIQNSWGPLWGEAGFIRLLRRDLKEENSFCGWDKSPEEGTACAGGPSKVRVCGSCGVLYDSVVPIFRLSPQGWWHKHGNRSVTEAAAAA